MPVIKTGLNKISFAIQAYDKMNSSASQDGIYSAKLYLDDEPQIQFVLDSISYDETVYINAQIDYKYRHSGGSWLQHVSKLPGDRGPVYKEIKGWNSSVTGVTEANMPVELSDYISFLERELRVPITLVSTGPDRTQTIHRR